MRLSHTSNSRSGGRSCGNVKGLVRPACHTAQAAGVAAGSCDGAGGGSSARIALRRSRSHGCVEFSLIVGAESSLTGALARRFGTRPDLRAFPSSLTMPADEDRTGAATVVQLGELMMILDLHRQGLSVTAIARRTGRDPKTIRKYIERGLELPAYGPRQVGRPNKLAPYLDYLRERVTAFPELTAIRLTREVRERGYTGAYTGSPSPMASRSSADKLKPLPPDPDRHQHSAIPRGRLLNLMRTCRGPKPRTKTVVRLRSHLQCT